MRNLKSRLQQLERRWFLLVRFFLSLAASFFVSLMGLAQVNSRPNWATSLKPPERPGLKCFLGSSPASEDRNLALADAYKNALLNVIEREFPELISIKTRSSERLDGSTYSRDTAYMSENVQFSGLTEDKESPYVDVDPSGKKFIALRVLCWSDTTLSAEKKRQAELLTERTATITNKIDGLLPPNTKPGPTGSLEITTIPAGATLLLAASPVGNSNARFDRVIAGSYEVVAHKEGYEIESRKVNVRAGKTSRIEIEMRKVRSQIVVNSEPQGAFVYVNNKPYGKRTPTTIEQVVGEEVDVRIEKDDFYSERRVLTVTNRPREEMFRLRAQDGVLSVLSTPSGAKVYINGKNVGHTPLVGYKVEGGKHEVRLKLSDYEESVEQVTLYRSMPRAIQTRLNPKRSASLKLSAKSEVQKTDCEAGDFCESYSALRSRLLEMCNMNEPEACTKLGWMNANGLGGEKDTVKARDLYTYGCDGNVARACLYAGHMWAAGVGGRSHGPKAQEYFEKARDLFTGYCDAGDLDACTQLGGLLRLGQGGERDLRKARYYYQKACNGGKKESCELLHAL